MQRIANPCTSVRLRDAPPFHFDEMLLDQPRAGFFVSAIWQSSLSLFPFYRFHGVATKYLDHFFGRHRYMDATEELYEYMILSLQQQLKGI